MKKFSALFIVVCLVLSMLTGCNRFYKEIQIKGGKIESVSMSGLRAVHMGLDVNIDNPLGKVDVCEIGGVVMHFGKVIGRVTLDPFVLERKSQENYHINAKIALDENIGIRQMMQFTNSQTLNECTIDIHLKARVAGVTVKKQFKNIPLKELFELK